MIFTELCNKDTIICFDRYFFRLVFNLQNKLDSVSFTPNFEHETAAEINSYVFYISFVVIFFLFIRTQCTTEYFSRNFGFTYNDAVTFCGYDYKGIPEPYSPKV